MLQKTFKEKKENIGEIAIHCELKKNKKKDSLFYKPKISPEGPLGWGCSDTLSSRDQTSQYFEQHHILNIEALYNQRLCEVIFSQAKTDPELFLAAIRILMHTTILEI